MIDPEAIAPALAAVGLEAMTSPGLVASGWESHIYRTETTGPTVAVRVFAERDPVRADREAAVIDTLRAAGYPVPAVHGRVDVGGHPAVVLDFIDGPALWSEDSPMSEDAADRLCRELLDRLHSIPVDPVADPLGWLRLGSANARDQLPAFRRWIDALWEREPEDTRAAWCHLDMHPGNVLWDGEPWVVDWTSAQVTDPRLDLGWSRLLSEMYAPDGAHHFVADDGSDWWDAMCGLRRLVIVAWMLAGGDHAADDLEEHIPAMRVPATWLARGTDIPIPDVESLLRGTRS